MESLSERKIIYKRALAPLPNIAILYPGSAFYYAFSGEHNDPGSVQNELATDVAYNAISIEQCFGSPGAGFTYINALLSGLSSLEAERLVVSGMHLQRGLALAEAVLDSCNAYKNNVGKEELEF